MSQHTRRARDALVGLLVALAPFAYKQHVLGHDYVAGLTIVVMAGVIVAYRYADAKTLEAVAAVAPEDADELKPILRRAGRWLRRRIEATRTPREG